MFTNRRLTRIVCLLALGIGWKGKASAVAQKREATGRYVAVPRSHFTNAIHVRRAFVPVVAQAIGYTVRVQVDARDVALGIVVDPDGWVLTKTISQQGNLVCRLRGGRRLSAKQVAGEQRFGLALLKVEAQGLTAAHLEHREPQTGRWVATVGPGAVPVAIGVVSVVAQPNSMVAFQHDTALRAADCGGPLVDLDGRLVGINLARRDRAATSAVSAQMVSKLLPDLMARKQPTANPTAAR